MEALDILRGAGLHGEIPLWLKYTGDFEAARRRFIRSAKLWGAADAAWDDAGFSLSPDERERNEPDIRAAKSAIGDEAHTNGWSLSRDEAIEVALQNPAHVLSIAEHD